MTAFLTSDTRRLAARAALVAAMAVALLGLSGPSGNATTAEEAFASKAGAHALQTAAYGGSAQQKVDRFKDLLRRYSNVKEVALFSLGKYEKQLPSNRANEYYSLVEDFAAKLFASYSGDFMGREVQVLRSAPRTANDIVVDSRILYNDDRRPAPVKWLVAKRGNKLNIYDVNIQGVWLSLFIQQKFVGILKKSKGDFEPLFAFLKE
jgi:ABC-type transporter MlaC component